MRAKVPAAFVCACLHRLPDRGRYVISGTCMSRHPMDVDFKISNNKHARLRRTVIIGKLARNSLAVCRDTSRADSVKVRTDVYLSTTKGSGKKNSHHCYNILHENQGFFFLLLLASFDVVWETSSAARQHRVFKRTRTRMNSWPTPSEFREKRKKWSKLDLVMQFIETLCRHVNRHARGNPIYSTCQHHVQKQMGC